MFATDHHELELSLSDPMEFDALVWSLDEPIADLSAVGFSALSALAARDVTVALSGQGADELLAGYPRYGQTQAVESLARLPGPLLRAAAASLGRASRLGRAARVATSRDRVAASIWAGRPGAPT